MKSIDLGQHIRAAVVSASLFLGLLAAWITLAPLEGAAIAPGHTRAQTESKSVQHAVGGKISEIYVRNGQRVSTGDPILKLDSDAQRTALLLAIKKLVVLKSELAVARAYLSNESDVTFSEDLLGAARRLDALALLHDARMLFLQRKENDQMKLALAGAKQRQLNASLSSSEKQLEGLKSQQQILEEQLVAMQRLEAEQHVTRTQLQTKQQQVLQLNILIDEQQGTINEAQAKLTALALESDLLTSDNQKYWRERLKTISTQLPDVEQQTEQLQLKIERGLVRAEYDGIVTHLAYQTAGAVIKPGEEILKLVPENDSLMIEARLAASEIHGVEIGQTARIRKLSDRSAPMIDGVVSRVSADRHLDDSGSFYRVEIELPEPGPLMVGEPVESILVREKRTILSYLFSPILEGTRRSLREA